MDPIEEDMEEASFTKPGFTKSSENFEITLQSSYQPGCGELGLPDKEVSTHWAYMVNILLLSCEEYQNSPSEDKLKSLKQDLDIACSKVDKAKNQGILHKNTAMRKKSTLQSIYNKLFVKSI